MASDSAMKDSTETVANDAGLDIPPPPGSTEEGDPMTAMHRIVAALEAEKAEANDRALRALAESQNIRKRAQREVEDASKFAVTRFARDVLAVADNLSRALQALPADRDALDQAVRNTIVGLEATQRELAAVMERHGIGRIEALGQAFNPELHQAMMEVDDPARPAGTVVQEMMPGYTIQGRLLRPAMVAVSRGGAAAAAAPG